MAVVQGGELRFVQPLDDGEDACVHKPNIGVSVPVTDFADTPIIVGLQGFDMVRSVGNIVQQSDENTRVQANVHPIVYLYQHRRRDDQGLIGLFNQLATGGVIRIAPV